MGQRIELGRQLAERRDSGALAGMLAEDFHGPHGMSRHDVRAMLLRLFFRYRQPHFLARVKRLRRLPDDGIEASLLVAMGSTPLTLERLGDLRARLMAIDLVFRDHGGEWMVERASWRNASLKDFLP